MRAILHGISVFSHWLTASARPDALGAGCLTLKDCGASRSIVSYLAQSFPLIPQPYHVLVPAGVRSFLPEAVAHSSTYEYDDRSFVRIGHGVFASCPELCFVQLMQCLPFHAAVHAGNALCGTFFLDPSRLERLGSRVPLTTVQRIEGYLQQNPGLYGIQNARRVLRWVVDGVASPPESFLAMALGLDQRYGGYGVPNLVVNERIVPSKKAQGIAGRETLKPDLCCRAARLVIEYDSNAEHLTPQQIMRDATKRLALEADGFKVITVTALQLGNRQEVRHVAEQACARMGRRLRIQSRRFEEQQARLFRMGWDFGSYIRGN